MIVKGKIVSDEWTEREDKAGDGEETRQMRLDDGFGRIRED
jgi:hypothetical protein